MSRKYEDFHGKSLVKEVQPHGNSARANLPKKWRGRLVRCTLIKKGEGSSGEVSEGSGPKPTADMGGGSRRESSGGLYGGSGPYDSTNEDLLM